jgi:hypothetical protein
VKRGTGEPGVSVFRGRGFETVLCASTPSGGFLFSSSFTSSAFALSSSLNLVAAQKGERRRVEGEAGLGLRQRESGGGLGESIRERSEEGYLRELVRVRLGWLLDGLNDGSKHFIPRNKPIAIYFVGLQQMN